MKRQLETLAIWDWFDGLVLGLVRPSWTGEKSLATLLNTSGDARAYALLPVSEADVSDISPEKDWDVLRGRLRALAARVSGFLSVITVDNRTGHVIRDGRADADDLRPHLFGDFEDSLAPDRARWQSPLA